MAKEEDRQREVDKVCKARATIIAAHQVLALLIKEVPEAMEVYRPLNFTDIEMVQRLNKATEKLSYHPAMQQSTRRDSHQ